MGRVMIRMKCPLCGAQLQFHDSATGLVRKCPQCKHQVRVDASVSGPPPPTAAKPIPKSSDAPPESN